jgi:hypothetical protein
VLPAVPLGVSRGQALLAPRGAPVDVGAAVRAAEANVSAAQSSGDKEDIRLARQALREATKEAKAQEQAYRKLQREASVGRDSVSLLKTMELHVDASLMKVGLWNEKRWMC